MEDGATVNKVYSLQTRTDKRALLFLPQQDITISTCIRWVFIITNRGLTFYPVDWT